MPMPSPTFFSLSRAERSLTFPPSPSLPPSLPTPWVLLNVFLLLRAVSILRVCADVSVFLQLFCKTLCIGSIIRAGYAGSTGLAVDCLKCGNTASVTIPSDMCSMTAFCWGDLWASAGLIFTCSECVRIYACMSMSVCAPIYTSNQMFILDKSLSAINKAHLKVKIISKCSKNSLHLQYPRHSLLIYKYVIS
jgi:hypothetical protein